MARGSLGKHAETESSANGSDECTPERASL